MVSTHSSSLLARIRASSRLTAWVLLVFVMKVGLVAACSAHDFETSALESNTAAGLTINADQASDDAKDPVPTQHAGCADCHCHHAAAMLPGLQAFALVSAHVDVSETVVCPRMATPRRELRPPIA